MDPRRVDWNKLIKLGTPALVGAAVILSDIADVLPVDTEAHTGKQDHSVMQSLLFYFENCRLKPGAFIVRIHFEVDRVFQKFFAPRVILLRLLLKGTDFGRPSVDLPVVEIRGLWVLNKQDVLFNARNVSL